MDNFDELDDAKILAAKKQWTIFVQKCLQNRISDEKFGALAAVLVKRTPLPGVDICAALLQHQLSTNTEKHVDPLVPAYIDALLHEQVVKSHHALLYYWQHSVHKHRSPSQQSGDAHKDTPAASQFLPLLLEESLFTTLGQQITTSLAPMSMRDAKTLLKAAVEWMTTLISANSAAMITDGEQPPQYSVTQLVLQVRQAVGIFVVAMLDNQSVRKVLDAGKTEVVKNFAEAMTLFSQLVSENLMEVSNQLAIAQKSHESLQPEAASALDGPEDSNVALGEIQLSNVMDAPIVPARSSLSIYLDSLLFGAPLINDTLLVHYLRSRYNDDSNAMMWLIVSSFDILASAVKRSEVAERMFLLQSFIVNKVPHILLTIARTSFSPINVEFVISHALAELDPTMFPSFSAGFEMGNRDTVLLVDARQNFLFACVLYELIPEEGIRRLLQGDPMQSAPSRLVKADLVANSSGSTQKLEQLIGRLERTDGNGGIVVEALTEIFHGLCGSKDTMSLKGLCNQLSRRPSSLDVISLFVNPAVFLQPLCQLIESWTYDDDQGEYQPLYEEFSACLLLVMAFVWRYRLSPTEIGVNSGEGFISRFFSEGYVSRPLEELSETQDKQLSGWIKALFETQAIGDDLMKICPPQDFYMLVPTLLKQSIIACRMETLSIETLKTGLELLLEAFLLPSLPYALSWLTQHIRQSPSDAQISVPILQTLILAPKIHGEALSMHTTILSLTAQPLINVMSEIRRSESMNNTATSQRQELEPMLTKLSPHANYSRVPAVTNTDITAWSAAPQNAAIAHQHRLGSNLSSGLRNTLQLLTLWSGQGGSTATVQMPIYTHIQLQANVKLIGAMPTLRCMVDEVKAQYNGGFPAITLDIVTNMIASTEIRRTVTALTLSALPMPIPPGSLRESAQLTLLEALRLELEDAAKIMLTDQARAETLVQLSRSVERTLTVPPAATEAAVSVTVDVAPVPVDLQPAPPQVDVPVDVMPDLGLGDGGELDQSFMDDMGLSQPHGAGEPELDAGVMDVNLDDLLPQSQQQNQQGQNVTNDLLGGGADGFDDDIFSGLGSLGGDGDMGDFGF